MKKISFALLAVLMLLASCSNNDESTPTVSFEKAALPLTKGSITLQLQVNHVDLKSLTTPVTIPVNFSGTAIKDSEYSVSAEQFVLGGANQSLAITVTAKDNYDAAKEIIATLGSVKGFELGKIATAKINLGVKGTVIYSFTTKTAVMSAAATIQLDLYNVDQSKYVAEEEMRIPVSVDAAKSTAVEGANFSFAGAKEIVIAQGQSSGTVVLNSGQLEAGKDTFVLKTDLDGKKGFVRGTYNQVTVSVFGSYFDKLAGSWKMSAVETDATYLDTNNWQGMVTYDGLPELNTNDTLTFDADGLTTSLQSTLKNFFMPTSGVTRGEEYSLRAGMNDTRPLQLILLDNTNRYFSATESSADKASYIGVRVVKNATTQAEELEVYLLDYTSKSFMPELLDFGMYGVTKPVATDTGLFLSYTFVRAK